MIHESTITPDTLLPHTIREEWESWGFVGNTDQDLWVHLQLHLAVHKSFFTKSVKSWSTPHDEELNKQNWDSYLYQPHTQHYFSMAESARYKRILPGLLIGYPKQKQKQKTVLDYIVNPILVRFSRSIRLDIGLVLFLRFYWPRIRFGPWKTVKRKRKEKEIKSWSITTHLDRTFDPAEKAYFMIVKFCDWYTHCI